MQSIFYWFKSSAIFCLVALPCWAHALGDNATSDVNGIVIDPFTDQTVQVWRRGGYLRRPGDAGVCSATQIHPNWVLTAKHCQPSTHLYYGPGTQMSGASALSECHAAPDADMTLCRLQHPEYYTSSAPYPVLSTMPPISSAPVPTDSSGNSVFFPAVTERYGHYMAIGWGGLENGKFLQFTSAGSFIKAHMEDRSTSPAWPFVTGERGAVIAVLGDSGGGLFWVYSPQAEPAMVGSLASSGGVVASGPKFNPDRLHWIASIITGAGDTAPEMATWEQLHTPHSLIPDLPAPPTVAFSANGQSAYVSWQLPGSGTDLVPVASYTLSRGILFQPDVNGGRLDNTVDTIPLGTTSIAIHGLPIEKSQAICITPANAEGKYAINAAGSLATKNAGSTDFTKYRIMPNNCAIDLDNRLPGAPQINLSTQNTSASVRLVTANWTLPVSPDVVVSKYVVSRTLKYPSGPARTSTWEQTTTNHSISVSKGVTVCINVQSVSKHGLKTNSITPCATAN